MKKFYLYLRRIELEKQQILENVLNRTDLSELIKVSFFKLELVVLCSSCYSFFFCNAFIRFNFITVLNKIYLYTLDDYFILLLNKLKELHNRCFTFSKFYCFFIAVV